MSRLVEVRAADLIGPALDWAVAVANGETNPQLRIGGGCVVAHGHTLRRFAPSTEWAHGGPMLDKFDVWLFGPTAAEPECGASIGQDVQNDVDGPTRLIAACRAIVANKFGKKVLIPAELLEASK